MSGIPGKIVLKSTTKISLTERYAVTSFAWEVGGCLAANAGAIEQPT